MIGAVCAYSSEWKENGHKAAKKRGFYKYTKLKAKSLTYHKFTCVVVENRVKSGVYCDMEGMVT